MTAIRVDLSAPTPAYEQIRSQVAGLVAVGDLRPGDRLPASRTLAHDLGIAVGTVQRAYRELEQTGVVASRRRTGTVVADAAPVAPGRGDPDVGKAALVRSARSLVERARGDGLGDEAILDLVRAILKER
jgi:GntR family transcriptional regulator